MAADVASGATEKSSDGVHVPKSFFSRALIVGFLAAGFFFAAAGDGFAAFFAAGFGVDSAAISAAWSAGFFSVVFFFFVVDLVKLFFPMETSFAVF
ncbi:MAG: hypothetical protein C4518_16050 [Desulfobacteraceae bacterium]|nr:MAG: hypothetical protein C4518_16050 [Desulfobacteraceae bacterium]